MKHQNSQSEVTVNTEIEKCSLLKHARLYSIIRKSALFFMIWFSLVLIYGVICAYTNEVGQDEFYRFIFFLRSPIVVVINSLTLLSALIHSFLWIKSVPIALNIGGTNHKHLQAFIITFLAGIIVLVSILFMLAIYR